MRKQEMPGRKAWPWRTVSGLAGLIVTLGIITIAQSNVQDEDAEANQVLSGGAFGYTAPDGRRVLAPVGPSLAREMGRFSKVVAAPGLVVDATFVAVRRTAAETADGQGPEAFDSTPGVIFATGDPVPGSTGVLVATEQFLAQRHVVPVTPVTPHPDCAPAVAEALAAHAGRAVLWCKDLATVGDDGGRLSLARFAPQGRKQLVSLAYTGPGGPIYADHPAETDPSGTWRADDGGEFPVDNYRPLFAFRTGDGLEVAVRWSGAEGEIMDLYHQKGQTFQPFVAASWYRGIE